MIILDSKNRDSLYQSMLGVLEKYSFDLNKLSQNEHNWKNFVFMVDYLLSFININNEGRDLIENFQDTISKSELELMNKPKGKYKEKIDVLLEVMPDVIFYLNENGIYLDLISAGNEEYPYKLFKTSQGKHISEILPKEYANIIEKANKKAIKSGKLVIVEYEMKTDMRSRFFEVRVISTPLIENNLKTSVVIIRDITSKRKSISYYQMMSKLFISYYHMMSKLFEEAEEGVFIVSLDGDYIGHNKAFSRIFGFDDNEIPPLKFGKNIEFMHPHKRTSIINGLDSAGKFKGEVLIKRGDKEILAFVSINTIKLTDSSVGYRLIVVTDISELQKSRDELYYTATHDILTGLPNRKFMLESMDKSIKRLLRENRQGALIFLDLDDFKRINDLLGHKAGDKILCGVAERIKTKIRSSDLFGRLGGDEFIIFLENIESADHIANLAQKIINILTSSFDIDGSKHKIGASLGIAIFPDDANNIGSLLRYADRAMYEAKKYGKNRYNFYNSEMRHSVKEFKRIEKVLKRAMKRKALCLFYQPQFEIRTGEIVGVEVLTRMDKRIGGGLGPKEFIPVAEESGLIVSLSNWILQEAFKQASKWQNIYDLNNIHISLNISDRQIMDEKWADEVLFFINRFNINPYLLEFEITENILMQSKQYDFKTLKKLRKIGCKLSLDDFGTGLISLSNLEPDMIHRIKIDQSFVSKLSSDKSAKRVVKASISLAHSMGLITVAEGVEKQKQKDELISLKCDQAQGYLLSPPLNSQEILRFILKRFVHSKRYWQS